MNKENINRLMALLKISFPLIQAPMAGSTSAELVAAVSNQGCLGSLGAGLMTPTDLQAAIKKIHTLTSSSFAVNLFVPGKHTVDQQKIDQMQQHLNIYRQKLNIPLQTTYSMPTSSNTFEQCIDIIIAEKVPVFSFTFGIPDAKYIAALKANNIIVIGTATNLAEGKMLEQAGCDAVVAQGYEAGGHRGSFAADVKNSSLGLMVLVTKLVDQLKIPVIASGGIMDGRGIAASLMLGAAAAQCGTLFLTSAEAATSDLYRQMLLKSSGEQTLLTRVFTGKYARAIANTFTDEMIDNDNIPDFPIQGRLTADIRAAAAQEKLADYLSLWAGQGVDIANPKLCSAKEKIDLLKQKTMELMDL